MGNLKENHKVYPVYADSTLYGTVHLEDNGFCHDIKKVSKAFVRSLKGLDEEFIDFLRIKFWMQIKTDSLQRS